MIDIHVQGSAWSEISQELRKMLGDEPAIVVEKSTDYEELEAMRRQLDEAEARYEALNNHCSDLAAEKTNVEVELVDARNKIDVLEETNDKLTDDITVLSNIIVEKDGIISDLKKQLADAKAPQQAEPTEGDTETPEPAPAEEEQTEIPEVTEAPVKEYKKEEVRAVLVKCRAANIAITEILAPYGGSLGAVKQEDYAKVVEAAEKALEGK